MAEKDYEEPELIIEDPDSVSQGHWRWVLPILVLLLVPVGGMMILGETTGDPAWPTHNAILQGHAPMRHEVAGTAGTASTIPVPSDDPAVIREVESITGLVDRHPLIGQKVELHVPVAERAADHAFWIGEPGNRLLVVLRRDHRDDVQRQEGLVAGNGIATLEPGKTAVIAGSIQKLPRFEDMYSWGLTRLDRAELGSMGVYLRADQVSVQQ
jgi:hypothetical protein